MANRETFPDGVKVGSLTEITSSERMAAFDAEGNLGFSTSPAAGLLLHEQTITSTELSNISTPLQLIAAPGAGKIIVVERVVAKMESQNTAYDFTNGLQMVYDTYSDAIAVFDNTFANSILDAYSSIAGGSVPAQPNAGVFLEAGSNPTQGDGIFHLKIHYRIVEF